MGSNIDQGRESITEATRREQIISHIFEQASRKRFDDIEVTNWSLDFGSKYLKLVWYEKTHSFVTIVETVPGAPRLPDETTMLYSAAKRLMEQAVATSGEPAKYTLTTENKKIAAWAGEKGDAVFHWDGHDVTEDPDGKEPNLYKFWKTFEPPEAEDEVA